MSKVYIRSTYSPKYDASISEFEPSLTHQSFKDECEIDYILKKYAAGGVLDHIKTTDGQYGDFTNIDDYQSALNRVHAAQESFMALPARIRSRFENDPGKFLSFTMDHSNIYEMADMGLLTDEAVQRLNAERVSKGEAQTKSEGA